MPGRPNKPRMRRAAIPKRPRLKLRIARGLEALGELPEGALTLPEQTILRRIDDIYRGTATGALNETDFQNLLRIAKRHRIRF